MSVRAVRTVAEVLVAVAAGLGAVAALNLVAPIQALTVVPLLVVLGLAIRRGRVAALAGAVLSVLAVNFFFIEPLYRLTIADDENVATRAGALAASSTNEAIRRLVSSASGCHCTPST